MQTNSKSILIIAFAVFACRQPIPEEETSVVAKVSVNVVELTQGSVQDGITLSANTLYLNRNVVTATIPAFITRVNIKLGQSVKRGQVLYELQTKEAKALGDQAVMPDSLSTTFGKIEITAPSAGIISTLDKQQTGDYVLEGSQLCTIAESDALAFAVNVPYEFSGLARAGMKCTLVLPDNTVHEALFTTPLTTMNVLTQTQTVLAKSRESLFLPENLIVKVFVSKSGKAQQQVLPKECVLSDEMLENFWVMKLLNDTTAIRVNVTLGNRNQTNVEIAAPTFEEHSKFLVSGNYGMPDTAFVKVTNQ